MINMSSSGKAFIYSIAGFFLGLFFIYRGTRRYLLLQKINNTPTSKVESAAIGLVELFGKAHYEGKMQSPIAKTKCAYWRLKAQYYKYGKHGGWKDIFTKDSGEPFYLKDETGKILIDPKGAEIDIPEDHLYEGSITKKGILNMLHNKMPEAVLEFLKEPGNEDMKNKIMWHKNEKVRIYEYFIAENDPLYVLGNAEPRKSIASDVAHENLIVKKGKYDKIMYVSDSHERKVIDRIKFNMVWNMAGGLILSAICLLIILWILKI